jgi:hypothetical protein
MSVGVEGSIDIERPLIAQHIVESILIEILGI